VLVTGLIGWCIRLEKYTNIWMEKYPRLIWPAFAGLFSVNRRGLRIPARKVSNETVPTLTLLTIAYSPHLFRFSGLVEERYELLHLLVAFIRTGWKIGALVRSGRQICQADFSRIGAIFNSLT
jgi:hypothetical protein